MPTSLRSASKAWIDRMPGAGPKLVLSGEVLSQIGIGVFTLDSLGRVVFSNPIGERLVGNATDLEGRLRIGSARERAAFDAAISRALQGEVGPAPISLLVRSAGSERSLAVYILSVSAQLNASEPFLAHARAIVLIIARGAEEPADPAVIRDVLGLTPGEARVAALVGSGLAPRKAAAKLGIAEETARSVLKRVFWKVGVSRQSELTALVTRLMPR